MLFQKNTKFDGFFLLKSSNVKTTSNGKPYLDMKLMDKDGEISAKLWDYDTHTGVHEQFQGKIVKVRATAEEYNGSMQLNVTNIRLATDTDSYNIDTIVPTAPIDVNTTAKLLRDLVGAIEDADYRKIASTMLDKVFAKFVHAPAAKAAHHAFISGLLMHTSNMVQMAYWLATLYPFVDKSLLVCGTVLHDIGKLQEMDVSDLGLVTDYSTEGKLLGHLYIGAMEVANTCKQLGVDPKKSQLLQHMLLSHHGLPEYGAVVRPQIAEAELLSQIDMLDAKMEIFRETLEKTGTNEWSDRNRYLDNRMVYNHAGVGSGQGDAV